MRTGLVALALGVLLSGCGGDDEARPGGGETFTAEEVTEAFASEGWSLEHLSVPDSGCGPSDEEQDELGITVFEETCLEGSFVVGEEGEPDAVLVTSNHDPAGIIVLVWSTPEQPEEAAAEEIDPIRRGNVVAHHYGDAAVGARIKRALAAL